MISVGELDFYQEPQRTLPPPPIHFLLLLCSLTANGMVRDNKEIQFSNFSSLRVPTPLCPRSPTVVLPHGAGEQRPLREHGGQQPAHHQLEPQTGLQVPVQAHSGLVRMLPERLQALGLPPLPGSASIAHLPSTRCDVLSETFSGCFSKAVGRKKKNKAFAKLFFWGRGEKAQEKNLLIPQQGN